MAKSKIIGAKKSKKIISETNGSKPLKKNVIKNYVKPKLTKTDITKRAMLAALEKSLGIVTTASKIAGISRATHYEWMAEDDEYKAFVDSIAEMTLDFVESKLHGQIAKGDTTASIFYLKTKGKSRGYIERTEIDHSIKKDTDIPVFNWVDTKKD